MNINVSHFRLRIWPIIFVAVALGLSTFLIPAPAGQDSILFHLSTALPVLTLGLFVPAVVLYITVFSRFKKQLRIAYSFIIAGFLSTALGTIQYPVINILNLTSSPWVTTGLIELPFIVGTFCAFMGAWLYARLVGIKRVWGLLVVMIGGSFAVAALATQLPHMPVMLPESDLDAIAALNALEGSFLLSGAILLLLIKRHTSLIYNRAMAWLFIVFTLAFTGCYTTLGVILVSGFETWFFTYNAFLIPFIIGGIACLKSAEAFHNVAKGDDIPFLTQAGDSNFFGQPKDLNPEHEATCVDVVMFLVSLCSNPEEVDRELDIVRRITAKKEPGQPFSSLEEEKLAQVALAIEQYLIGIEPIRKFSRQDLRQLVAERYREVVKAPDFWRKFETA